MMDKQTDWSSVGTASFGPNPWSTSDGVDDVTLIIADDLHPPQPNDPHGTTIRQLLFAANAPLEELTFVFTIHSIKYLVGDTLMIMAMLRTYEAHLLFNIIWLAAVVTAMLHPNPIGHDGNVNTNTNTNDTKSSNQLMADCLPSYYWTGSSCSLCNPGYYCPGTGGLQQACPAGTENPYQGRSSSSSCAPCANGYFHEQPGQAHCWSCPPGYKGKGTGQTSCEPCASGTQTINRGQTTCSTCPINTWTPFTASPATPNPSCRFCPDGSFTSSPGATVCTQCTAGRYGSISNGHTECQDCKGGTYSSSSGASFCSVCEAGKISVAGATTCAECAAGYYQPWALSAGLPNQCAACLAGTFSNTTGLTHCYSCPANTYQANIGRSFCNACTYPLVSQPSSTSSAACVTPSPCGYGHTLSGGSTCSTYCGQGYYTTNLNDPTGPYLCSICPPGTWSQFNPNYATDTRDYYVCTACASGKSTRAGQFALSPTVCSSCAAGYYNPTAGGECIKCAPGTYSVDGAASCTACPAGYIGDLPNGGSLECFACGPGRFSSTGGLTVCSVCDAGKSSTQPHGTTCTNCAAGRYNPTPGNINSTMSLGCSPCQAGWYSGEGKTECSTCGYGQWSPAGATTCSFCPNGRYAIESSTTCTECAAGKYSNQDANGYHQSCDNCEIGKYQSATGASTCISCPSGMTTYFDGATSSLNCS